MRAPATCTSCAVPSPNWRSVMPGRTVHAALLTMAVTTCAACTGMCQNSMVCSLKFLRHECDVMPVCLQSSPLVVARCRHSKDLAGPGELHDTRHKSHSAKHLKPEQADQSQLDQQTTPEGTAGMVAAAGQGGAGAGTAVGGATGMGCASRAPAPAVTTKARLGAAKKGGGKPGLGVKKLGTKVDEALFDQAPASEAAPAPPASLSEPLLVGSGAASGGAGEAAARASRFSYDLFTAVSWGLVGSGEPLCSSWQHSHCLHLLV